MMNRRQTEGELRNGLATLHPPMIPEAFHRLREKLHGLWQHLPLKGLGVLSATLPMVAAVASAVLAFMGNQNRQRMETSVTRHFEMVERLGNLLTLMLDTETGLRGHLLTQRAEFLEPFALARCSLPAALESLHAFIEAEPGVGPRGQKRARLEQIRGTVEQEMTLLARLRDARTIQLSGAADEELSTQLIQSKALMDPLRDQLRGMQDEEKRLLGERLAEIRQVRRRDYLSISLALLLGLGWGEVAEGGVFAMRVAAAFDAVEDFPALTGSIFKASTLEHLAFEGADEGFSPGVVVRVGAGRPALAHPGLGQSLAEGRAAVLTATVAVEDRVLRRARSERRAQGGLGDHRASGNRGVWCPG